MGVLGQAGLLLWKNLKLRQRRPILTITQIAWPLLIFGVIAILRTSFPAKDAAECQYNARAVPSSGVLPFMQSMVCDLESSCVTDSVPSNEVPTLADAQIGKTIEGLEPIFLNDSVTDTIKALPKTLAPVNDFVETVGDSVKNLTENQPQVADFFRNATQVKNVLQDLGIQREAVDAIFDAEVDTWEALNLVGSASFDQLCNVTVLQQLLIFPPETNVAEVSAALCNLTSEEVSELVNQLIAGLDTLYITEEIEDFLVFVEPYGLDKFLGDVKAIRDQLENSDDLNDLLEIIPQLIQLTKVAPVIESIIEEITRDPTQRLIEELLSVIERIDGYLQNVPWWQSFMEILDSVLKLMKIFDNTGDVRDKGIKLIYLIQNSTRLAEKVDVPSEILEMLLKSEIQLHQVQLFTELLENPEKAVAVICTGNISQVIMLPPDVDPTAATMVLCNLNITDLFAGLRDEIDLAIVLNEVTKLLEESLNVGNHTLDFEEVLNQTFILIDQLNQIRDMPLSADMLIDFLETFHNFSKLDTSAIEYWLGLFISSNDTFESSKNESSIIEYWVDPVVTLVLAELAQTPFWPHIQKQLIIQSLYLDLSLHLVETFASGGCPENWRSHTPSCYQYAYDKVDYAASLEVCLSLHSQAHPVVINHVNEQKFLQTIGENELIWLGLDEGSNGLYWLDGEEVKYSNWMNFDVTSECGVVNFGQDGRWSSKICTETASNLCEAPQEHAIVTLIKNSPLSDLSELMLQIGPNATEALLLEIYDPTTIEMLLTKGTNLTFELCSESFLDAIGSDLPDDILTQICAWDLEAFWQSQMEYWKFPEIQEKITELEKISLTEPDKIPESYYPLADFKLIISKQNMLTEMITAATMVPLNLESVLVSLQPNIEITGTPEEWLAVAERFNNYLYQQQLEQLIDQLEQLGNIGGLLQNFIYSYQQQLAIQEVINIAVEAGNTVFEIIEDLSKGIISDSEPETQKLLMGIKKLLESSNEIQAAIEESVETPGKAFQFFNAVMQENFFCNATLRDSVLDLKEDERQTFDNYICAVDYPVFFMEMAVLLDVSEIQKLIQFYIPYNTSADLLPFPNPTENQDIWNEYVNYLININEIRSQFIETYNLTKMEVLFSVPDFTNISSLANILDMLEPILSTYGIDVEALKLIQTAIENFLSPGSGKDLRVEDILQELKPLLNSTGIDVKDLEELAAVLDDLLQKNISPDLSLSQILDILEPYLNTTGLDIPYSLQLLDVVLTNILSFDNSTKMSFLSIIDELEPLLEASNISLNALEFIRSIIEYIHAPGEITEFSLMALLEELEPYLDGSDINMEALTVLDLVISHLVPVENITEERIMDLINELEPYLNINGTDPAWMETISGVLANITVSLENASTSDILQLLEALRPFLDDPAINFEGLKILEAILKGINSLTTETDPYKWVESLGEILSMFENSTWIEPILQNLFIEDLVNVALFDVFTQFTGIVYTFPDDLGMLTDPDDVENFIPIIYRSSDIVQVLFGIALDQTKISQLIASPDIILTLCQNGSLHFFNTSFSQGVDLVSLQSDLCKVDLGAVLAEIQTYPPLAMLLNEVPYYLQGEPLPPFNLTAYLVHSEELNKAIENFLLDPIEIRVNQTWLNGTTSDLLQVLIDFEQSQNEAMLMQQLESLQMVLGVLHQANITWISETEDAVQILLGSISYSNDILETLPGQNITFEDILPSYLAEQLTKSFEYSADITALILQSAVNMEQLMAISVGEDILSVLCANVSSLETILELPAEVNITAAQYIICSINETAVSVEIMTEFQKVLSKAELDREIDVMKATEVVEDFIANVVELKQSPPDFSQFDDVWIETTARKMEAILKSLEFVQTLPTNLNDLGLEMIFQILQEVLKDDPGFQFWLIQLRLEEYFTVLLIEQAKDLTGKNISFQEVNNYLGEYPSLQGILSLREVIPEVVDILLALSTNPEKLEQFWNSSNPFQSSCESGTFSYFFELPINSTTNLTSLEDRLCSLNGMAVLSEIDSLLGITEIQMEIQKIVNLDPSLPPLNFTAALFLRDIEVQSVFTDLFEDPPTFYFDHEFWQETRMELEQVLSNWEEDLNKLLQPSDTLAELSTLIEVIEGQLGNFENETWYQSYLANMRLMDYVNELIIEWATDLQGKVLTLPTLDEIFQNSSNIRELLELTDLTSDIIDAFLSLSLTPQKWTLFWTMPAQIQTLCELDEFTDFFQLPEDSSSNITAVANAVCSVNLTAVDIELKKFLGLNEISAEISKILFNSASLGPYNWTASFILSMQVQNAVQGLVEDPPTISLDPIWWNQTRSEIAIAVERWLKGIEEMVSLPTGSTDVMGIIETLLGELDGFKNETWYENIVQQMRINDLVNTLLISLATDLQGKTLTLPTLEELFVNSTNIRQLLELSSVAPDIIDAFLALSLQPNKWESFWAMQDPIPTLCASGNFTSFFQLLPGSTSDITAVSDAICSLNFAAIGEEFRDLIKLDDIMLKFSVILSNDPSLGPYNWTASYILSQRLNTAISDLIQNPPVIELDTMWWNETLKELEIVVNQWSLYLLESTPGQVDNTSIEWLSEVISNIEERLSDFRNESWYQDIVRQMRIMDLVNKLIIEWASRFQGQTLTLPTLDELFENSTHVRELLELTYLTPDLIDVFLSLSVQEEKWSAFLAMDNPIATLCAAGNFTVFFQLPPDSSSDITAVADAVCSVNLTAVNKELTYLLQVDSTLSQISLILYNHPSLGPYNWTASIQLSQDVQKAIADLITNPPIFLVDPVWLNQTRTDFILVIQQWWTRLTETSSTDPAGTDRFAGIVEMISSSLTPLLENSEWYKGVIQSQRIMDEVNKIILHWAQELNGKTIILPHLDGLFENATHVREILALQDLGPEFIELLVSLSFKPGKFEEFFMTDKPFASLCVNSTFAEFFDLPTESKVNISELQNSVCSVNLTAVERELNYLFQVDSITLKFMQIFFNDPTLGPYNWTASIILSQQVQEAIAHLLAGPPIFSVDSDWLDSTLSALKYSLEQELARFTDMFGEPGSQKSIENILQELEMFLNQSGLWYKVQPVLESVTLFLDLYISQTEQSFDDLKDYLNISVPLDVAVDLATMSADEFKAYIISTIVPSPTLAYIHNNGLWDAIFCNETAFNQHVHLPSYEIINVTALRVKLCETNSTQLLQDLQGYYGFDIIKLQEMIGRIFIEPPMARDFDWQELINLTQELTSLFEKIKESPSLIHGSFNFSEIYERLLALETAVLEQNIETAMILLKDLGPLFDLEGLGFSIRDLLDSINQQMELLQVWMGLDHMINMTGISTVDVLEMIESSLKECGVWNQVRPLIEITNLLLGGTNEWLYPLGLSPSQVFYNATVLTDVLSRHTDLVPALMETKTITDFVPLLQLAFLHNNNLWDKAWQCSNNSEGVPDYEKYKDVLKMLCSVNQTEFFEQVSGLLKVDILELEKQLSSLQSPSPISNMTTIPLDWEELISNVQLFTNAQREILSLIASIGNRGSDSSPLSVIWEVVANMDIFNGPMSGQILEMMESFLPTDNPFLRSYIPAITVLAEQINTEFEAVKNHSIEVTTFFELQVELMDLIQEILSESNLQAFLQAQINVEVLASITNFEDVAYIFCDGDQFNLLLTFPSSSEIDVGAIQRSLCDLAKSSNATIQLGLYHYLQLGAIYQQAVKLFTNNNGAGFPQQDVDWEYSLGELQKVVNNFMNIQIRPEDLLTLLTQFSGVGLPKLPVTGSPEDLLNQIYAQVDSILTNNTMWEQVKGYIPAVTQLAESINAEFAEIRELGINATIFFKLQTDLMELIQEILSENELQALLQADINEEILASITNFEDVAYTFCDDDQFNLLLTFPSSSEIDVEAIQRSLCDLVKSSNVTIQLGLYHYLKLGSIYQQVMRLLTNNYNEGFPSEEVNLMDTVAELNLLIANFMSIDIDQIWHVVMDLLMEGDLLGGFPMLPINDMPLTPTSVCEMVLPIVGPFLSGSIAENLLIKTDLFTQVVNQLYFDLPDYEEEIQSLLNDQSLVGELMWTVFQESPDALTALQGISRDMEQIYLLRALSLDIILGNLHDIACSEDDLRSVLNISKEQDISELSSFICSADAIIQTQFVQELLVIIDFESAANKIRMINGNTFEKLPPLSCSSLFGNGEEFVINTLVLLNDPTAFQLELEIPGFMELVDDVTSIIQNVTSGDYDSLQDLFELLDQFLEEDIVNETGTARLVIDELLQLYDSYIDAINKVPGVIPVDSLWWNSTGVASLLLKETGLTVDDITMLMKGSINVTVIAELKNLTVLNWGNLVCDKDVFMKLLVLSSDELESLVYQETCMHPNKEMLFDEITQRFNLFKFLSETSQSAIPVPTFVEFLTEILSTIDNFKTLNSTAVEDLLNVLPLLNEVDDISDLMNIVPVLSNLTLHLDSFEELFDNLEPVLGGTSQFQQAKALYELLVEKEYVLDVLKEFPDLIVEKILKFPDQMRLFLEEELSLPSGIVDNIFKALLNPELLLSANITKSLDNICSKEIFNKYLDFAQGTNLTVVSDAICGQNISTFGEVLAILLDDFNTNGIMDALTSSGIFETIANMTNSFQNITQSLGEIQKLQEAVPSLIESAVSLEEIFDEETLEEFSKGGNAAFTLLQENSDLFCASEESFRKRRRRQISSSPSASNDFCQDLYNSLQTGIFGEIQWAFVKPILLGKILYTPKNEASEKIIQKANKVFEDLTEISVVAQSWLNGVNELMNLLESPALEDIENLLGNAYISGLLETELNIDADSLQAVLQGDLTSIPVQALNQLSVLAELVVNMTSCLELERFMGFESEAEMEEYAARLNVDSLYLAGITFMNLDDAIDVPKHVKYALRMDTDRTPSTEFLTDIYWRPGQRNNFITQQQYLQGFVFLQDMIERAVIELHSTSEELSDVYIQQMPYPCYKNDRYLFIASIIFPLLFTIGFLILMAVMTHQLVYEKERGIEELMKVMGLRSGINWFAWFVSNAVLLSVLMLVIAIILRMATIVAKTQFSVLIVFLLCFAFSLIMQSYMVSSFFQKANIAALGALLVYLILYVPYGFIFTRGGKVSVIGSLAVSLASPSAFSFGSLIISRFEHQGIGSSWSNIWENPRDEDHSTLAASCIMMVVDGLIYFFIGWYIRTIFPGKFGVPRPWYFPFQASYWNSKVQSDASQSSTSEGRVNEAYQEEGATPMKEIGTAEVESEPLHAPVGIAIQNLSKVYDSKCPSIENRALDKMTLNFYEGQVTALLGSNGAGKTTVISIITGLYPASGGSVNIYDQKVGVNAGVRGSDLGLCPQHNALYDELTVKEHLKIFGRLKGMSKEELTEQGIMLLDELHLMDMLNVPVHKLSGGMKRKLCVAISLMGNAKTVILDEPTSGVDPHARRAVWDLIIRSKKDRTIVLCTHFMDEADLLGDRIAILDRGQLRCCGSSAFLKSKFTSGVKLTLSKERPSGNSTPQSTKKLAIEEPAKGSGHEATARKAKSNVYEDLPVSAAQEATEAGESDEGSASSSSGVSSVTDLCDSRKVTQFLTSRVDGITLLKEVGSELVYQLPSTKEEKTKFPQLFRDLDEQLSALHIRNYGVSDTNLEEVFLKVSTHSDSFMETNVDQSEEVTEDPPKWNKNLSGQSNEALLGGQLTSAFQQVRGILLKRFHITRRDWRGFIWAVLMPVAMLAVGTFMAEFYPVPAFPPLQLTPAMYEDPNYVFFSNGETSSKIGQRFTNAFLNAPGIGTTCMSDADEMDRYPCEFTESFFPEPLSNLSDEEKRRILEEDLLSPLCVCEDGRSVCDEETGGVPPPEWVTNTSIILQDLSLKTDVTEYLLSTRQRYEQNRYGGVTFVDIKDGSINRTVIKAWYSNIGYHALPTYINVANNVLLRASLPAGSNPAEYGITAYNHPVELAEASPDVTGWDIASVQFGMILFLMTALAMIPATLSTLMVQENLNGAKRLHFVSGVTPARYWFTNLIWDMLLYIVPAVLIIIILLIFGIEAFISDNNIGTFILLLIVYGFAIFSQYYLLVPIFSDTGTAFVTFFCSNLVIFLLTNLPTFLDYLQLANYERSEALPVLNDIFLILTPFCMSSALLTMLYNQLETDIYASYGVEKITYPLYIVRWNIIAMVIHAVVAMVVILFLEYIKKKRMDCNLSPKRSLYEQEDEDVEEERNRVLSGGATEDVISLKDITKVYSVGRRKITAVDHISFGVPKGECFGLLGVNGAGKTTLFKTITTAIAPSYGTIQLNAKSIGYCPQVDAIYDQLTGEEILYCYARLKGIKEEYIKEVVDDMTARMGMTEFSRKVISTYSGGMKRTLSVAVSLLGNPQLVLMDEPTAGMDPVSKQAVWRGIQAANLDGRSVMVTSHSMEECENLCTRLAIMVNGQFQCLGSPQHVKHRHGEGYTLILHLSSGGKKSADLNSVARFIEATFPESVLKEHHLTMLRYQLSSTGFCLADIYEAVEKERDTLGIEEYSVTQTTLDQVFVNFAKKQTDGHGDDASSISSLGKTNPAFDPESLTVV